MVIKRQSPRNALGNALANDHGGKVSEADARKIKQAVVDDVAKAKDPEKALAEGLQVIETAREYAGADKDTMGVLQSAVSAGQNAMSIRMGELTGDAPIPVQIKAHLVDWLDGAMVIDNPRDVNLSKVKGDEDKGFSFHLKAGELDTEAFALKFDGDWVVTPQKLSKAELKKAVAAAQEAYDEVRSNADPDGEYGFEDVSVGIRGADWEADELTLSFSHGAPEGGLMATYDKATGSWDAWDEQM